MKLKRRVKYAYNNYSLQTLNELYFDREYEVNSTTCLPYPSIHPIQLNSKLAATNLQHLVKQKHWFVGALYVFSIVERKEYTLLPELVNEFNNHPILNAVHAICGYYLGSFGVAVVKFITIFSCVKCFLKSLECCLDVLSEKKSVFKSFCDSRIISFTISFTNLVRAAVTVISKHLEFIENVVITIISAICNIFFSNNYNIYVSHEVSLHKYKYKITNGSHNELSDDYTNKKTPAIHVTITPSLSITELKAMYGDISEAHLPPKPSKPTPSPNKNTSKPDIVTSVSRNDAANALLAKFGAKKQSKPPSKPNPKPKPNPSQSTGNLQSKNIVGSVNRNDAANALTALFGAKKKQNKSPSPSPIPTASNNKAKFKKYEIMLKVGVDLSGVLTQMKKDNLNKDLIDEFNKSHGGSDLEEKEETDPIKLGLPMEPPINITKGINMKRLHWEPLKLSLIKESMWYKCDQSWIDYKAVTFELKFQTRKQKPKVSKDALKYGVNDGQDEKKLSNEKIKFVSAKRSQQVQIGLKSYHMTNNQLRKMILTLDETKIDINSLTASIDIIPTPEEQLAAERAKEDNEIKNFGISERFFYSLYDIIEITPRCKKWLFMLQFKSKCDRLEEMITLIEKSKIAITRSQHLRDIFSIILAFGNHMNSGNKLRGNCYGFHLNCLSLLPQIKTFDNAMTFPMFLYDFLEKKDAKLLDIIKQFKVIDKAQHITGETIEKAYDELVNEIKDLSAMINRYKDEYFETLCFEDKFLDVMNEFESIAKKRMWKLKFKYDAFHKCEKQLIKYFGYNLEEEAISINKILKDIWTFIEMLSSAKVKLDILEQQRKKKLLRRKKSSKKHRRRKSDEDVMKKMNKRASFLAVKPRVSKRFAIGLDDIGTPLAEQQTNNNNMTFTQMVMGASTVSPGGIPNTLDVIVDIESMNNAYKNTLTPENVKTRPSKPTYKAPKVNIKAKLGAIHVRRNSDPTTPMTPSNNSQRKFGLNKNILRIKAVTGNEPTKGKDKNRVSINLMSSQSKLTPSGEKSHANVDHDIEKNKNKNKNKYKNNMNVKKNNYKGRHGYQKSNSDITAIVSPQHRQLKNRRKIPPKRPIPSKKLPSTPQNAKKWRKKITTNV